VRCRQSMEQVTCSPVNIVKIFIFLLCIAKAIEYFDHVNIHIFTMHRHSMQQVTCSPRFGAKFSRFFCIYSHRFLLQVFPLSARTPSQPQSSLLPIYMYIYVCMYVYIYIYIYIYIGIYR
jgi:hypothetical protein